MASPYEDDEDAIDDEIDNNNQRILDIVTEAIHLLSDDDEETSSRQTRRPPRNRDRLAGHEMLVRDYFADNPVYDDQLFARRFRMSKRLFKRIVDDLEANYQFFEWLWDARGKKGFSPLQKCTAAIRQLAYGSAADSFDEYLRMSEKTSRECMNTFCKGIIHLYRRKYLRKPTSDDVQKLYALHEARHGLPGMLGSLDCTHWAWANYPVAWMGQYMRGDHERPTIILEVVASQDLWFCHAFFGVAGSSNDINVLQQSSLFNDVYDDKAPDCSFDVHNSHYKHGYYLVDGIYPDWATFVKSFTCPQDDKRKKFKTAQESARKDVERAFGVLRQRWHVIHNPARKWSPKTLRNIMYACVILHNMILEDEGRAVYDFDENDITSADIETNISEEQRAANVREIKNQETHYLLQGSLIDHIWSLD